MLNVCREAAKFNHLFCFFHRENGVEFLLSFNMHFFAAGNLWKTNVES